MIATYRTRGRFALTLGAMALAVLAFVALAVPSDAGTDLGWQQVEQATSAGIDFNRNLTAAQASYGLRYQCMQDFRQCTRGISISSAWTAELGQQAFDAEYAACCYEAELCGDFLSSLGTRPITRDYDDDIAAACAVINDAQSSVHSTHAVLARKVEADAVP